MTYQTSKWKLKLKKRVKERKGGERYHSVKNTKENSIFKVLKSHLKPTLKLLELNT